MQTPENRNWSGRQLLAAWTYVNLFALCFVVLSARANDSAIFNPGPRIIWSMDGSGYALHRIDVDHGLDELVGYLPYSSSFAAEKNWTTVAETSYHTLYFVRATGKSDWHLQLYSVPTSLLAIDSSQTIAVGPLASLNLQIAAGQQYLGLTAGPDDKLYLTVFNDLLEDYSTSDGSAVANGLWRIDPKTLKVELVGGFAGFQSGILGTHDARAPKNALCGGIAYDESAGCFYGYGYNPQGKGRLYKLDATDVLHKTGQIFSRQCWVTNHVDGLWGIAFDNYAMRYNAHYRDVYVTHNNDGVYRFDDAASLNRDPHYKVANPTDGYGIALEPYYGDVAIFHRDPYFRPHEPVLVYPAPVWYLPGPRKVGEFLQEISSIASQLQNKKARQLLLRATKQATDGIEAKKLPKVDR
jgi:hypothetical protein